MHFRAVRTIHALIGALLVFTLASVSPALAAQAGGSKQIITGQTVTWTADWTPEPDVSLADENVELLALSHDTSIVGYGGTSFPVAANQVRDIMLEGFASEESIQQIDRGDYDNVSYSIDLATTNGIPLAIFTLVVESPANTTMAMLISAPGEFGGAMTSAQAGIAIDGAQIFEGVDAAQMQATISGAQGTAGGGQPAPTQPSGGLGDLGTAINGGTATPEDPAVAGAAPSNVATIPTSGTEVLYSNDWAIDSEGDGSISFGTVQAPAALVTVLDLGPTSGVVDASTLASGLQGQVESLADAEVVAALNPSPDRVVIVFRDPSTAGTLYRVYDIALDPGATTSVTLIVAEGQLDAAVELVGSTILVNGEPVMADIRQLVPHIFSAA
jgi:hypothetical protein